MVSLEEAAIRDLDGHRCSFLSLDARLEKSDVVRGDTWVVTQVKAKQGPGFGNGAVGQGFDHLEVEASTRETEVLKAGVVLDELAEVQGDFTAQKLACCLRSLLCGLWLTIVLSSISKLA